MDLADGLAEKKQKRNLYNGNNEDCNKTSRLVPFYPIAYASQKKI